MYIYTYLYVYGYIHIRSALHENLHGGLFFFFFFSKRPDIFRYTYECICIHICVHYTAIYVNGYKMTNIRKYIVCNTDIGNKYVARRTRVNRDE